MSRLCLGYNTNGFPTHRLDDTLQILSENGYAAVALTLDVHHLDPFRSSDDDIDRIGGLLRELDFRCVVETGARYLLDSERKHQPTLVSREAEGRERRIAYLVRAVELAGRLGAEAVSMKN